MTVHQLQQTLTARLTEATGSGREASAMMRDIWDAVKGWSQVDVILHRDTEVSDYICDKMTRIAERVAAGEPLQYILGHAHFYGMTLTVTPDVLIPRPETAEMVDLIVHRYGSRRDMKVLDLCTGCGCIAIALARNLPFAQVHAEDISTAALAVAADNAHDLRCRNVEFHHGDVLTLEAPQQPLYDIIVSNPPYIIDSERGQMSPTVTDHEPSSALFVPDNDPLRFYTPIAHYALAALRPGGALYFEINPLFAAEMRQMLSALFDNVDIQRDMQGRLRFAIADTPVQ